MRGGAPLERCNNGRVKIADEKLGHAITRAVVVGIASPSQNVQLMVRPWLDWRRERGP